MGIRESSDVCSGWNPSSGQNNILSSLTSQREKSSAASMEYVSHRLQETGPHTDSTVSFTAHNKRPPPIPSYTHTHHTWL